MYGRRVALLINGFLAYYTAIDVYNEKFPGGLQNVSIFFLPFNITFIC